MAKENLCVTIDREIRDWIEQHSIGWKKSALVNMMLKNYITTHPDEVKGPERYHGCEEYSGFIQGIYNKERNHYELRCDKCDFLSILTRRRDSE